MEDEQYYRWGDKPSRAGRVIKGILVTFVFVLAGLLFFRFWLNGYYPAAVRTLIPTEPLRAAMAEGGTLDAATQKLRVSYDDPNEGRFFAGQMVFSKETGSLQVTVRWNRSTLDLLKEEYGDAFDPEADTLFRYRLFAATENGEEEISSGGDTIRGSAFFPVDSRRADFAMYGYERLAFEGIDFEGVPWIRIEIYVGESETYRSDIVVYENHEKYHAFEVYTVGKEELS